MAKEKADRAYSAPAVDRALDILEFMASHHRPYGSTEIARELNIPTNSVFRILKRLTERKYTIQDPATGGYLLSHQIFSLGMSLYTRFELRNSARSHLQKLCRDTEETCQLQIPHGDRMLVVDTYSPETDFYLRVVPGSLVHYHPNAYGKAVLAFMDVEHIKTILPKRLIGLTPKTIIDRDVFIEGLDSVRETGLAYDDEEYTSGIFCIGSPVFNYENEPVAGLGATCLLSTLNNEKKKTRIERRVLECACNLSQEIGYTGDYFNNKVY